jgi:hypothetical protein
MTRTKSTVALILFSSIALAFVPASAGAHTWDVFEIFSNADGTIQFIELREMNGTAGEVGVGNGTITSNINVFDIPSDVASPTTNKHILFGTPAFDALFSQLPGNPHVDFMFPVFPVNMIPFFSVNGDTIRYTPYDARTFGAGQLPTDGSMSLNLNTTTGTLVPLVNTPENYAGQTGTIDATPPPPGVPDGRAGSTPMLVSKLDPSGSQLSISWGTTCGSTQYSILFGDRSQLPTLPGGAFAVGGSVCGIAASPYTWNPTPVPVQGPLVWWLIVTRDQTTEGPWGKDSQGVERVGPGAGGSSLQCGATAKDTTSACGQ